MFPKTFFKVWGVILVVIMGVSHGCGGGSGGDSGGKPDGGGNGDGKPLTDSGRIQKILQNENMLIQLSQ